MDSLKSEFTVDLPYVSSIFFTKISKVFRPKFSPPSSCTLWPPLSVQSLKHEAQPCDHGAEIFPNSVTDHRCPHTTQCPEAGFKAKSLTRRALPFMGNNLPKDTSRGQVQRRRGTEEWLSPLNSLLSLVPRPGGSLVP